MGRKTNNFPPSLSAFNTTHMINQEGEKEGIERMKMEQARKMKWLLRSPDRRLADVTGRLPG